MRSHLQNDRNTVSELFLTGGAAPLLISHLEADVLFHPHLVLSGIAIAAGQQPARS